MVVARTPCGTRPRELARRPLWYLRSDRCGRPSPVGRGDSQRATRRGTLLHRADHDALRTNDGRWGGDGERGVESGQADGARSGFIGPRLSGCRQAWFKLVAVRMGGTEELSEEEQEAARGGRDPLIPSSRPKGAHHHAPHIPTTALTLKVEGVKPDQPASIARAIFSGVQYLLRSARDAKQLTRGSSRRPARHRAPPERGSTSSRAPPAQPTISRTRRWRPGDLR